MENTHTIFQAKNGITLTDGFFLAKNPRTQILSIIRIYKGVVYIHDATRKMSLTDLVSLDSAGFLEIFEELKSKELSKQKSKNKKE